jgi:hypothetical protein
VLLPEGEIDLEPNRRYRISILAEAPPEAKSAWDVLDEMAGSVEGPEDWSAELDHYLYGTPKRHHEAP